eukprot:TRINITY_DN2295_c0_g1_i1.p1 TRINITY_DN2295_c0_g1~~TRINITY_DN2295_c0_g1_i1.p1  ORF type:complete len:236 (+),score=42.94 TRINITY_DN2295_c0_g1_i1:213-920(+)
MTTVGDRDYRHSSDSEGGEEGNNNGGAEGDHVNKGLRSKARKNILKWYMNRFKEYHQLLINDEEARLKYARGRTVADLQEMHKRFKEYHSSILEKKRDGEDESQSAPSKRGGKGEAGKKSKSKGKKETKKAQRKGSDSSIHDCESARTKERGRLDRFEGYVKTDIDFRETFAMFLDTHAIKWLVSEECRVTEEYKKEYVKAWVGIRQYLKSVELGITDCELKLDYEINPPTKQFL